LQLSFNHEASNALSLTSFLKIPEVRQRFIAEFPVTGSKPKGEIRAPIITDNPARIGTAFDYLLRFYLERLNPNCKIEPWVAEHTATLLGRAPKFQMRVNEIIRDARAVHQEYLRSGEMKDELIGSAVLLAQIDVIYRAGILDEDFGTVKANDIADLRQLIGIVDPLVFKARSLCILNPTFGEASNLVGGADADFIVDDTLVDIKTTKNLEFGRDYFNQLVGYYLLGRIGGTIGVVKGAKISRLGIYYSRYGLLYTLDAAQIENHQELDRFVAWFVERAREEFPVEAQ
jgi:hypothetical protein